MPVGHYVQRATGTKNKTYTDSRARGRLFLRLALIPFCLAGRLGLHLGSNIEDDASAVAPASRACAMGHARRAALAYGELLGLEGMVATAVSRMRLGVSHPDYHGSIYSILGAKRQTPSGARSTGLTCCSMSATILSWRSWHVTPSP